MERGTAGIFAKYNIADCNVHQTVLGCMVMRTDTMVFLLEKTPYNFLVAYKETCVLDTLPKSLFPFSFKAEVVGINQCSAAPAAPTITVNKINAKKDRKIEPLKS